jgi:ABC-type glycerol-3-phosphate transport system substrate-binding protein
MRYMRGGTLRESLTHGPLAGDALGRMVDQVGAALEAAHLSGVTHGDVSASNVLVDEAGNFYLADFEIATVELIGASPSGRGVAAAERAAVSDVADLAVTVAQAATGRTDPISDLLVGMEPALAEVLSTATRGDGAPAYPDAGALRQALATVLRTDERSRTPVIDENPYKGLRSFEPSDSRDFFGRDRFVERVVARLGRAGVQGRLVAVVGPSGSGKSSVVKAGLLPALRNGAAPGSEHWFAVDMTPGAHPFEALESALRTVAVNPPASLLELLLGERGINRAVDRVLPADDAALLVVVDQFEELFTHSPPDTTARFLDALVEAIHGDHSRVKVVVTLRADFYDRPLRHRGMGELLRMGTEVLTPMSPDELERAVSGPAERVGARVEPALVGELVAAVADRPVALPLLQYTLTEVFDRRIGGMLTLSAYRELGGISGALADRAEALYAELGPDEQRSAQQVFLRLVSLGEGSGDTRRRVLLSELTAMTDVGRFATRVVETFGRHRLLAFDRDPVTREPTVEISHEALLTTWARLRRWVDDARSDIRAERILAEAAREWVQNERDEAFVLGTGRLARYVGWRSAPPVDVTAEERDLLTASEEADLRRRETQVRQERRDVQLRRRSVFLVGLAALTAVVVALGAVAVVQERRASDLADRIQLTAEARRLSREAQLHVREDPELALVLAVEAARVTAGRGEVVPEAMDALHAGIQAVRVQYPVRSADVAARAGVGGGVFLLPPDDLIRLAQDQLSGDLSDTECQAAGLSGCPNPSRPLPEGLAIAGGSDQYAGPPSAQPLAGTQVTVVVPGEAVEREALEANFEDFSRETGIEVIAAAPRDVDFSTASAWLDAASGDADIGIPPHPGMIPELAAGGAMDLTRYLDRPDLEAAWGPYLADLMTVGPDASWPSATGSVFGIWHNFHAKSVIWYAPAAFEQAGYEVPTTWDELISLSDRMVADGNTPWCIGLESGDASGWPATDLLEAVLLKGQGPELYDAWVAHEVPFDHPAVLDAARRVGQLVFTPGHLLGGSRQAARVWYGEGTMQLLADPPQCWMFPMASFARSFLDPSGDPSDLAVFDFPLLDSPHADAMVGAGNFAVVLTDRPEVRAVVEFMASPEYGGPAADLEVGFVPPNMDFDPAGIESEADRTMIELVQAALAGDSFRFDASDLMAPEVGAGAFWEGMVDWFVEGPESLGPIMAAIEAAWPEAGK